MKLVNRIKKNNKYILLISEIKTVNELETLLKNPTSQLKYKVNNFLNFIESDIPYIKSIVESDVKFNKTSLFESFLFNIFKYKSQIDINYWLVRGWNKTIAEEKISEMQSKRLKKFHKNIKNQPNRKEYYNTCLEYWLKKGFSYEDAKLKLKNRQSTFSLKKCIESYGEIKGKELFNNRQEKWKKSLYGKMTINERIQFEKSKMTSLGKASKESLKVFTKIIEHFNFNENDYYIGMENNKEYCLYCKTLNKVFFYDFTIPKYKCIIEFNGKLWHPNGENWKPLYFINKTKDEIEHKEKLKIDTAYEHNFNILKIWDDSSVDDNIKKCIDFINLYKQ